MNLLYDGAYDHSKESEAKGERNSVVDGVCNNHSVVALILTVSSGLDNAGKTTIVKKFNGEPIDTISPTLGFNIKTLEHKGYVSSLIFSTFNSL